MNVRYQYGGINDEDPINRILANKVKGKRPDGMRVKRMQDGGRTSNLLRMLESQQLQPELEYQQPSSTRVDMPRPIYTSPEEANIAESRAGMQTFFGEDRKEFDPTKTQGVKPVYPLAEVTPAGDVKAISESLAEDKKAEAALLAGLALTPIPTNTVKRIYNSIESFVRPSNFDAAEKVIDIIKFRGDPAELIKTSGMSGDIMQMSDEARKNLADDLRALGETEIYDNEEIGQKIIDAGDYLEKFSTPTAREDLPDSIGSFKKTMTPEDVEEGTVMRYTTDDGGFMELRKYKDPYGDFGEVYEMDIFARGEGGPAQEAGKLLKAAIEEVPKGGVMNFQGTLSTDSYPLVMKYIESGKASVVESGEPLMLNASGRNPVLFARTFNVDKQDVIDMFGADPMKQREAYARSREAIDKKLKSLGMPRSNFDVLDGLMMPHPVIKKNLEKGEFMDGGVIKPVRVLKK